MSGEQPKTPTIKQELTGSEVNEIMARQRLVQFNNANFMASNDFLNNYIIELAKKHNLDPQKVIIEGNSIYEK